MRITRDLRFQGRVTYITRDMCFSGGGNVYYLGCVPRVGDNTYH